VAPVGIGPSRREAFSEEQRFVRYTKQAGRVVEEDLGAVRFVPARPLIRG
jgi:hypothetical protein